MDLKHFLDGEEVLETSQVVARTHLNLNKLYELLRYDRFPKPIKYKNKNIWKKSDIDDYIKNQGKR